MGKREESQILKKIDPDFKVLTAAELSQLIKDKVPARDQRVFTQNTGKMTEMTQEAEELVERNQTFRAIQVLEHALTLSFYTADMVYGVLGDAYAKKGESDKALEMYRKSGSYDSLKKARRLEG